jgi:hypothetical protein
MLKCSVMVMARSRYLEFSRWIWSMTTRSSQVRPPRRIAWHHFALLID